MKRITLILWLLLSTTIWTFAYDFQSGGLYYNITSNYAMEVEVTYQKLSSENYSGLTSAVIPESVTYRGYTFRVTSIGYNAFDGCCSLISVTIPNSVTSIEYRAFGGCSGLTSISIPNGVTWIGNSAFYNCSGLASVTIPNGVTSIGFGILSGCSSLISITVENGNTVYDSRNNCNAIIETQNNTLIAGCQNSIIPDSVTSIEYRAFGGCSGLTSITIPNSVTSIGNDAFSGCRGLNSVTIPSSVTSIGNHAFENVANIIYSGTATGAPWDARSMNGYVEDYLVYKNASKTNLLACFCSAAGDITIPNSVTDIGESAFSGCSGLTSVTIPDNVTWIGGSAFSDCSGLTSITIPDGVTTIEYGTFSGCSGLTSITIPNSVTSIGKSAFSSCSGLTSIAIPSSVTSIGGGAFSDCSGLTSIAIPNSVTSIERSAFFGCSGLASITIPNGVTSIGYMAFYGCSGLTSVTIPSSVTSIDGYAFEDCSSLTSITIPNSITSIGRSAFFGCSSLTSVTWNAKNYADCTSGATPFYYSNRSGKDFDLRSQITSFVFGDSVQHIPAYICNGMDKLVSIHIGKDVMSIGNYALAGCTSLTHVKWNALDYTATNPFYCESVGDTIGFDLRKQITSFVCGEGVYAITPNICYQMTKLDTLACPAMALESEDTNMENYPKALKYVKILNGEFTETIQSILSGSRKNIRTLDLGGVSNTEIPDEAFREFYKMDTLVLPAQLTKIPYKAISECVALQSIVVPEGVTEIEYGAFSGCSGLQSLTLPSTLLSIADNGFASCSALKEMRVHAQTPPTAFANTFSGVKRTIPVYVPQSAYNDYTAAEVWKEFFIQGDVADAVENAPANDTRNQDVRKVLRNGQIYILRGDKTYTLTGEEL